MHGKSTPLDPVNRISSLIFSLQCLSASEDSSMIYVAVGFGFFVEMTHDEALRFIEKKTSQLTMSVHILFFCVCFFYLLLD